jgi:hypothetical protein
MPAILEMPFVYTALVLKQGDKTAKRTAVIAREAFMLEENSLREAPVAAVLKHIGPRGGQIKTTYRLAGGKLLRAFPTTFGRSGASLGPAPGLDGARAHAAALYDAAVQGQPRALNWNLGPSGEVIAQPVPERELITRKWISDDRDERRTALQDYMSSASLVDGCVYVPSSGPALNVSVEYLEGQANAHCAILCCRAEPEIVWLPNLPIRGWTDILRADRTQDAHNLLSHTEKNLPDGWTAIRRADIRGEIDIRIPGIMPDPTDTFLQRSLSRTLSDMGKDVFRMDDGDILNYADLRDAVGAGRPAVELYDNAEKLSNAIARHKIRPWPWMVNKRCPISAFFSLEDRIASASALHDTDAPSTGRAP